jgi:hypothetical protein
MIGLFSSRFSHRLRYKQQQSNEFKYTTHESKFVGLICLIVGVRIGTSRFNLHEPDYLPATACTSSSSTRLLVKLLLVRVPPRRNFPRRAGASFSFPALSGKYS